MSHILHKSNGPFSWFQYFVPPLEIFNHGGPMVVCRVYKVIVSNGRNLGNM